MRWRSRLKWVLHNSHPYLNSHDEVDDGDDYYKGGDDDGDGDRDMQTREMTPGRSK